MRVLLAAVATLLLAPTAAQAATITVDTTADTSPSHCTLRDAITAAEGNAPTGACPAGSGADTIEIAVVGQIALGSALPSITHDLTINGLGPAYLDVHRNSGGSYRIFNVTGSPTVSISQLTVSNGSTTAAFPGGGGAGIANSGTLTLSNVTMTGNSASSSGTGAYAAGGGIYNAGTGTLHVNDSTLSGNSATATGPGSGDSAKAEGGAIMNTGTMTIGRTTVHANTDTATGVAGAQAGGAISGGGNATITASTVDGNTTTATASGAGAGADTWGGGIDQHNLGSAVSGALTLDRDTIANNSLVSSHGTGGAAVDHGGGIALYSSVASSITSATIAGNSANSAGSGQNIVLNSTSTPTVQNTIVSGAVGALNCKIESGGFDSLGHNLVSEGSCNFNDSTDRSDPNTLLRPLADDGGPTETIGFFDFSPAKDGGLTPPGETVDQRGYLRPFNWVSIDDYGSGNSGDIGPLEFQPTFITPVRRDFGALPPGTASQAQTFTLTNDYGSGLTLDQVELTGPDAADFQLIPSTDSCSNNTPFDDHETCSFDIKFAPQTDELRPRSATVQLTNDAPGKPPTLIPLSGLVFGGALPSPPDPPSQTPPGQTPQGQTQGTTATATGQRATALAKCKKKKSARAHRKCKKKANALPV